MKPTLETVADTTLRKIHAEPFIPAAAMVARVLVNSSNAMTIDGNDLPTTLANLLASSGAAAAISTATTGTDLTTSGVLTTLGTNIAAHDTQGVTLFADMLGTTGAGSAIAAKTDLVTTSTPTTGGTVTAGTTGANELVNLTPAGTLATLTFVFPSNANSRIGQILTLLSSQIVTALTVSSAGLTLNGNAVTALAVNVPVVFVKTAASTWNRKDSLGTASGLIITAPVITTGLTASGSASNDFSGSTGTFKTSTGANQLSGATTIADATTPSLTTASGSTNTGFVTILGKTSGGLKITTADATAQTLTVSAAAQTVGAATLTIPNVASVSDTFVFTTLAQTLANKTFTAPVIGVATGTSLAVTGLLSSSSSSAGVGYATGAGGTVTQITSRATGVVLSKITGQITTINSSLAAAAFADFIVTNTTVAATDVVVANITPGGTGSPRVNVVNVAAGSFTLRVTNDHATTADTSADVINFAVIKAVAA